MWILNVTTLCLRALVHFGNLWSTFTWSELRWRFRFYALKCTSDAWQKRQNGFPLCATKNMNFPTLLKMSCVDLHIFSLLCLFPPAILRTTWRKLFTIHMIWCTSACDITQTGFCLCATQTGLAGEWMAAPGWALLTLVLWHPLKSRMKPAITTVQNQPGWPGLL